MQQDDGDVSMGDAPSATAVAPQHAASVGAADRRSVAEAASLTMARLNGMPVFVPLERQDEILFRMTQKRWGHGQGPAYRVMTLQEAARGFPMQDIPMGEGTPLSPLENAALRNKQTVVYARSRASTAVHARKHLAQHMSGMDSNEADAMANRLASELAAWSAYDVLPPSLREEHKQSSSKSRGVPATISRDESMSEVDMSTPKKKEPALLAARRERDARQMLAADAGRVDGPLPCTNMAYRDGRVSATPTSTQNQRNAAALGVMSALAKALTGKDERNQPKPVSRILMRARDLVNSGVLLVRNQQQAVDQAAKDQRVGQAILVHAAEAEALLAGKFDSDIEKAAHNAESKALLERWTQAHQHDKDHEQKLGLKRKTLLETRDFFAFQAKPTELGYECARRLGYYRPENLTTNPKTEKPSLPMRTGLPISRTTLDAFMQRHRSDLDTAACWRMSPDAVMPTCRAMNLLVQGISPYHMGAHAMLEEYAVMIRFAIDRLSVPGVRPQAPSGADAWIRDEETSKQVRELADQRAMRAMSVLKSTDPKFWPLVLPPWCGGWFLPSAYMPRANTEAQLDALYEPGTLQHRVVGRAWLGFSAKARASPTHFLDAFGRACDEEMAKQQQQHKRGTGGGRRSRKKGKGVRGREQKHGSSWMEVDGDDANKEEKSDAPMDTEQRIKAEIAERYRIMTEPDRTRAGRAETLMGLTVVPAYHALVRTIVVGHDQRIDALRRKHGAGLDCGNGYLVRPSAYYDEFWFACLDYLAQMLQIHELTLLVLNSRWLDLRKAMGRLESAATRMVAKNVRHAHPQTVQRVLERREEELVRRVSVDGRGEQLLAGPRRWPSREGTFPARDGGAWVDEPVRGKALEDRPDLPTYRQLVLFDQLIDYKPSEHERHGKATEDEEMALLTARTKLLAVRMARRAQIDPQSASRHHQLPMPTPGAQTAQTKRDHRQEENQGHRQQQPPAASQGSSKRTRSHEADAEMRD